MYMLEENGDGYQSPYADDTLRCGAFFDEEIASIKPATSYYMGREIAVRRCNAIKVIPGSLAITPVRIMTPMD